MESPTHNHWTFIVSNTPLRLSEAIRLGAMLKPQAIGKWKGRVSKGWFGTQETTCALAAAHEAAGLAPIRRPKGSAVIIGARGINEGRRQVLSVESWVLPEMPSEWLTWMVVPCPSMFDRCDLRNARLSRIIEHLNDDHRWTREQIADWVATVEAQQESAAMEPALADAAVDPGASNQLLQSTRDAS